MESMRDRLGVLLMEEADGTVAVQLFHDPVKAGESFDNLKGKDGQAPQRATFINLDYVRASVISVSKDLPVPEPSVEDKPDGWRLGEGPVKFDIK